MKKLIAALLICSISASAQKKDSTNQLFLDTVPAYLRVITGIQKGSLMGKWIHGYIVLEKGKSMYVFGEGSFKPYYVDERKKKITQPVIQSYQ